MDNKLYLNLHEMRAGGLSATCLKRDDFKVTQILAGH